MHLEPVGHRKSMTIVKKRRSNHLATSTPTLAYQMVAYQRKIRGDAANLSQARCGMVYCANVMCVGVFLQIAMRLTSHSQKDAHSSFGYVCACLCVVKRSVL